MYTCAPLVLIHVVQSLVRPDTCAANSCFDQANILMMHPRESCSDLCTREALINVGVPHHFSRDDRVESVLTLRANSPCPHEKIQLIRASLDTDIPARTQPPYNAVFLSANA